ncbi:YhdP family protein [Aquisalimonas asiatica]|uniref:TIGR02099 family protein n=1 Tax=Aquisalimonas asiatica TaxID=406100 RepID=A0A1H8S9G7_9GAMM|nr:YhdP family protein [Aquisalimonas asiatica]SEO75370.1 TIGR02099 family protein [Aquisalimonas asiatica]
MLTLLTRTFRMVVGLLAALLVLLAVAFALARLGVHYLPEYRAQVETRLGAAVGQDIRIEGLQAHWAWRDLRLTLDGVRLGDGDDSVLLPRLEVNLDLLASLQDRMVRLNELVLVEPRLTVQRDSDGAFRVVGVGIEPGAAGLDELDVLMAQPGRLRVQGGRMDLLDLVHQERYHFADLDAALDDVDGQRRLAGSGRLPEGWGNRVRFAVHWPTDAEQPLTNGPVDVYAEGEDVGARVMERMLGRPGEPPYAALSGSLELWASFGEGLPQPDGRHRQGDLLVRARDGAADMPYLFRERIPFSELDAEVAWSLNDDGWTVNVGRSRVLNDDGEVHGRVRVDKPWDGAPFLDIRASIDGSAGNAANTGRYLPVAIMMPALVEWLDGGILAGTARNADVVFHGRADHFPFDNGTGRFHVRADVADVTLAYHPEWPEITGLDGALRFEGRSMAIDATDGVISGARIREARASIDDLQRSPLRVDGAFSGSGDAYFDFLSTMPAGGDVLAGPLGALQLDGQHDLQLGLVIPFDGEPVTIDGTATLNDGRLRLPDRDLAIDGLDGQVHFDQRGIRSEGVTGRFLDGPLMLGLSTDDTGTDEDRIRLAVSLDALDAGRLETALTGGEGLLSGVGAAQVDVRFPVFDADPEQQELTVDVAIASAMDGIGVAMPAPLGKPETGERPLALSFRIGADGLEPLQLDYGDDVNAVIALDHEAGLQSAALRFGGNPAALPPSGSLRIDGLLPALDLLAWHRWADDRVPDNGGDGPELDAIDLTVGSLAVGDALQFRNQRVRGERDVTGWLFTLAGEDLAGELRWPQSPNLAVEADFELLRLPVPDEPDVDGEPAARDDALLAEVDPSTLPSLRAQVDRLELDGRLLGSLQLLGGPDDDGYRLTNILMRGEHHTLTGTAGWLRDPDHRTELAIDVRSDDMGGLMSGLGYQDVIRGGTGRASFDLNARSAPVPLALETLSGDVSLRLRNGHLTQVEPGAGRVFGLLSVANLPRRLVLNFGDVFDEGFAFDRIDGEFLIEDGIATPGVLVMDGPAARVEATGPLDLKERTYDQLVTVTPRASATLPILGGVFGGPPGAAAMLLAQQVFSGGFDRVAQLRYRVTGPWVEPVIEPVRRAQQPAAAPLESGAAPGNAD